MDLTQEQWARQLHHDENAVILDVRTEDEYNEGFIPNAINLDIYEGQGFVDKVGSLDRDKNYYVYCKAGSRSHQACQLMNNLGFMNAFNLSGGLMNWRGDVDHP